MTSTPALFDYFPEPAFQVSCAPGLDAVESWFHGRPNLELRVGQVMRQSIDEVLDGQRTGRYDIRQLEKTEKTYLGTKVEILLRNEFDLVPGSSMDYSVAGHDVDSKFSLSSGWMIPTEAVGEICLVSTADDVRGTFSVGLVRAMEAALTKGGNKDSKRSLSKEGKTAIRWLVKDGSLPENLLLKMPEIDLDLVVKAGGTSGSSRRGGQQRVNELFRREWVQGRVVGRSTILTVARQDDGPKRVRDARIHLRPEGIVVLGHQGEHPRIARELDLTVPSKGQWTAVRLVMSEDPGRAGTVIGGTRYSVALSDESSAAAPILTGEG
ncbi:NaeI family type II restriction endonuclease [Kitasatospora sp. P5_F3]